MPKVSVIIPVFNTAEFLPRCLDSVCHQTLPDIEVICVDDCSADRSREILHGYAAADARIRLVELPTNRGAAAARNAGMSRATGDYLGFVDSDDYVDPGFYERLWTVAKLRSSDVVKGSMVVEDGQPDSLVSAFYDINKEVRADPACFLHSFTTAIYRTSFLRRHDIRFPEQYRMFEDPYFSITAGFYYRDVEVVDDVGYHYVSRTGSLSGCQDAGSVSSAAGAVLALEGRLLEALSGNLISVAHYVVVQAFLIDSLRALMNRPGGDESCRQTVSETLSGIRRSAPYLDLVDEQCSRQASHLAARRRVRMLATHVRIRADRSSVS